MINKTPPYGILIMSLLSHVTIQLGFSGLSLSWRMKETGRARASAINRKIVRKRKIWLLLYPDVIGVNILCNHRRPGMSI